MSGTICSGVMRAALAESCEFGVGVGFDLGDMLGGTTQPGGSFCSIDSSVSRTDDPPLKRPQDRRRV